MTLIERFYLHVHKTETCWLWTGALDKDGYGRFWWNGRTGRTARFIFEWTYGALGEGLIPRHTCDNARCVRPDHLIAGTQADNIQDCWRRGRASLNARAMRGTENGNHKLTPDAVRAIRARYSKGAAPHPSPVSLRGLAQEFGVSKYAIQCIVKGLTWRHLGDSDTV
jgi:hypothetical protein